jgi:Lipase (class 3)/FYVE zinc finger
MQFSSEKRGEVQILQGRQQQPQYPSTIVCDASPNLAESAARSTNDATTTSIILSPPTFWFDEDVVKEESKPAIMFSTVRKLDGSGLQNNILVIDGNRENELPNIQDEVGSSTPDLPTPLLQHGTIADTADNVPTIESNKSVLHDSPPPPPWLSIAATSSVGTPALGGSPTWIEISQDVLPKTLQESFCTAINRVWYQTQKVYANTIHFRKRRLLYSDYGNSTVGYIRPNAVIAANIVPSPTEIATLQLPSFSTLPWIERQMVQEWRSYLPPDTTTVATIDGTHKYTDSSSDDNIGSISDTSIGMEEEDMTKEFDRARTLIPKPLSRPKWKMSDACMKCYQIFGPTCLRHHCRRCGNSFCHTHSNQVHTLPQYGYHPSVPERVCEECKRTLLHQNLLERIMWRLARCRDHCDATRVLQPYFEIGYDSIDQIIMRITQAALTMAKTIPLGAQATVAVETVDVLRKYGLNGIYTIMLRQEFLSAADLLLKALGINRTAWPLSVHELSAAIFYALAQHRAMRGLFPDQEHYIHSIRRTVHNNSLDNRQDQTSTPDLARSSYEVEEDEVSHFEPVCDTVSDPDLMPLLHYAPIALNFIYIEKEVDMQLLAAQQGWRLLYAYLDQADIVHMKLYDRPASAIFVHEERKIACLAVRGTTTIHDVITDIRQVPVPFPDYDVVAATTRRLGDASERNDVDDDDEWTSVFRSNGLAASGMVGAAINLYREHIDSLLLLSRQGYRIRLTGHSLGGSVAVLLGVLVYQDLLDLAGKDAFDHMEEGDAPLRVYSYGTPSCVDLSLAEAVDTFVTTVVLHDDVVPRLTPVSCRGLLKHLLHIRETWVKEHLRDDIRAFTDRAKTAWAPRWRPGFTLSAKTSVKIKRYYRKHIQYGKSQLRYVKDRLVGDDGAICTPKTQIINQENDFPDVPSWNSTQISLEDATTSAREQEANLVIDFLGGMNTNCQSLVVDDEEYFDPSARLLDTGDNDSDSTNDIIDQSRDCLNSKNEASHNQASDAVADPGDNTPNVDCNEIPGTVFLEEVPLPQMFIPGKIVHLYSHRGVYRAAYVPRTFRDLRRISLAGNMLSDHKTKSYFDALTEVANVRNAQENPPRWTAFDEDDTW